MKIKEDGAASDADDLDPQFPPGHPPSVPYHWTANKMAKLVDVINTSLAPYNTSLALHNTSQDSLLPGGRDEALAQVEVAILATILTLAVGGNSCVLVALARRRKIASRMHMFILHLSVADLLVAFFNILPQLLWDISGTFHGGDFLCRLVTFLQVFVMYLSTYVLVMTAVDRYRAICHPLSNYNWSQRTINLLIGAIYFLSAVLSLPQPLLFKYQVVPGYDHYDCWADFNPPWLLKFYILSFTLAVYIIPFFILVFAYGSICFTIWAKQPRSAAEEDAGCRQEETAHLKSADGHGVHNHVDTRGSPLLSLPTTPGGRGGHLSHNSNSNNSVRGRPRNGFVRPRAHSMRGFSRAKLKTVKLTFVVIVAYLFCWSPYFISQLWWMYDPSQEDNKAVVIMALLGSLNSCCNPWIYLAFSGNLLRHLVPCCRRRPHCCAPCTRSRNPAHYVTPSPTPSATEPRGIRMVALLGRRKERQYGGIRMTLQGRGGRRYDVSEESQQNMVSRHALRESLTSLLTMRLSRTLLAAGAALRHKLFPREGREGLRRAG
ncbi:cephalotocin receptor 2-like [Pomacea canaliculata]|uniref:cephalotocin receptor 2-like n=1 Tax=Pomacea canaliculata TaxID=400727 RepID=UPI000D73F296|nr:cephalotocin receptor 2-like [Pomacea canaliculata]XP_025114189.1 cephalotocin receptor 2-like [Pomacea canaliculata]